jgi:hypothetical protein
MIWLRKLLVSLFALLALLALTGGVVAYSFNSAFSTPTKIEQWLDASKLYEHFLASSSSQAAQTSDSTLSQPTTLSSDDPLVKQSIQTAFPKQLIDQSIMTFLNANYDWLQGKSANPVFKIDLTGPKMQFAQQIGTAVATHLSGQPVCTSEQLRQLQTNDLLHITCRPPGVDPAVAALDVQRQIISNEGLLSNPVLTAESLASHSGPTGGSKPYYKQLSRAPQIYQAAQKLPYAFGVLAIVSIIVIFLAAPSKRYAWRHLAKILLTAGIILSIGRLAFEAAFNKAQDKFLSASNAGAVQNSLTDFAHRAVGYITHIDLLAGLACLGLAALIIIGLLVTRKRGRQPPPPIVEQVVPASDSPPPADASGKRPHGLGKRGSIQ